MTTPVGQAFVDAVRSRERVGGLSHSFYRYPARFSPLFARVAISAFSNPGDVVLDPFMGGGTTLVEARAAGRLAIGTDINSLAVFVSKVKTTALSNHDIEEVGAWVEALSSGLNLHRPAERDTAWMNRGYQKNISTRKTWPIRKLLVHCHASKCG
ncbi:MAG TPA: DNA methyltransferase [Tepidisphaeraceae bacterium]|nr:DNA methyltransferase [Tepidisphaeraceae bacterium]